MVTHLHAGCGQFLLNVYGMQALVTRIIDAANVYVHIFYTQTLAYEIYIHVGITDNPFVNNLSD